ncbi:MAG: GGDEF domain-containing protein [Actinomycetota bacterium]|nr:GGDEF domain-containing protein [Actinomycetota bacterium]
MGDEMLVSFAAVLRRTVRGSDVPARLGGDEFAVVLPAVGCAGDATRVAERILAECREPLTVAGHRLQLRGSIGVAVAEHRPDGTAENCDAAELLHRADLAMYTAKRRRTHSWVLYSPDTMDADAAQAGAAAQTSSTTSAIDSRTRAGR